MECPHPALIHMSSYQAICQSCLKLKRYSSLCETTPATSPLSFCSPTRHRKHAKRALSIPLCAAQIRDSLLELPIHFTCPTPCSKLDSAKSPLPLPCSWTLPCTQKGGPQSYVSHMGAYPRLLMGISRTGSLPSALRSTHRRNVPTSDEVVLGLIGANVAVYILWQFADLSFMSKHFVISLENLKSGSLHTMLTSAFSHSELDHLVTNMIGLYFFGTNISRLFGPAFLLKLYVAGALGGSVFFLLHRIYLESAQPFYRRAHALGASAAVNAIILLDVFLFPKNIYYVNLVIPVPAILMGAFIIGSDLWRIKKGDNNISGSAHMGGAFVALLAWVAVKKGWF